MIKFNFTKRLFTLLGVVLFSLHSFAGEFTIGASDSSGQYSDYYIHLNWSGQPCGNFDCSCDNQYYYLGTTGFGSANVLNYNATGHIDTGDLFIPIGPNTLKTLYFQVMLTGTDISSGCYTCTLGCTYTANHPQDQRWGPTGGDSVVVVTDYIRSPNSLIDTIKTLAGFQVVALGWAKGSDIPDDSLGGYKVYRNGALIATLAPGTYAYTDSALLSTATYTYSVTTYTDKWGGEESYQYGAEIFVPVTNTVLAATKGTYYGYSGLTWPNIATFAPNDIQVIRDGVQLAVVNKNTTSYDDYNGVPGVHYQYAVAPINAQNLSPFEFTDSGYSKPNGVLSGYVRSLQGSGVPGVTITATGTVDGSSHYTYTGLTDGTGYYSINNIFYDTGAVYTVVPTRGSDQFNPGSISRDITIQNYTNSLPDIEDTTVFTVRGQVTYSGHPGCGVAGATVVVNGGYTGVVTDGGGNFAYTAVTPGVYVFSIQYANHRFDSLTRTVNVTASLGGINFHDMTRDTLVIDLKSGCHSQVCHNATFEVLSDPTGPDAGCFDSLYHFDGYDEIVLTLPAMKYRVVVDSAYQPGGAPDLNITTSLNPIDIDLTQRDTSYVTTLDTTFTYVPAVHDTLANDSVIYTPADTFISHIDSVTTPYAPYLAARFVYHGNLSITLTQVPTFCGGYVVNEWQPYLVGIYVNEISHYNGDSTVCLQDTGNVQIYDYVSGAGMSTAPLVNGEVLYNLVPGPPNVPDASPIHQYQDLFNVFVSAGSETANLNAWMLIQGQKTLTATFVSKTPPMPLMVLHDPPGSASYTSWQKDSSFSLDISALANTTLLGGAYGQVEVGKVVVVPATGVQLPGPYFNATLQGSGGYSKDSNQSQTMTITANQTISTSSAPAYVGFNGDVFIGSTVDTKYAFAYELNLNGCTPVLDTVLIWNIDSIESNFLYSALDIKTTILPQLVNLLSAAPDSNKAYFQNQINMWQEVLTNDSIDIANSTYTQNISFSAGVSYDYSIESDSNYQNTYNYTNLANISSTIGGGYSDANLLNINAGATLQWSSSYNKSRVGTADQSTTYDYHLEDDIPGNFYSVNIGKDSHFGSPVFSIFAGTSACPWEPGTQHRDVPVLTIDPGVLYNVPAGSPAAFQAILNNQSESMETRTYQVSLAPQTNPDGADVKVGGQDITSNPASFTIGYGAPLTTSLTVTQGPFAADYDGLAISLSSSCDPTVSVTVPISVHFQSTCSAVSLALPNENWLANSSNNDTLWVAFTGYDASNPNLQEIGLQYKLNGAASWSSGPAVPVSALTQPYITIPFNLTSLPDGTYQIRAYANCGAVTGGITYSTALDGVIDRAGFTIFGTPSPSDGVLNLTDNISVQFNENIDCQQIYEPIVVTLANAATGAPIADSFTCYGNGLIITTNPDTLINSLDGQTLTATVNDVFDVNGNHLSAPISWSFLVNRSKVYWSPPNVNITAVVNSGPSIIGTMLNAGAADSFTIIKVPSWLTVTQPGPYHLSPGTPASPSQDTIGFLVSNSLNQGQYSDTVIALADGKREYLFVNLSVVTQSPNWSVNPAAFQYSMNITANYSLTSLNAPLSTDTRDIIAAFVGNQCRGVAHLTYNGTSNSYDAFITAYSNSTVGDTFTFRIWDALPGVEYQAAERLPFITDGSIGQPFAPYILHASGVFQNIPLTTGWNWFSLNVNATDMSPKNILSNITASNGEIVKTQNSYAQYTNASAGWQGTLTAFNTNTSYMILLDQPDTLVVLGQPVGDTSIISVASGWNWIGFPRESISADTSYLHNANAATGDLIKSQTQYAQFTAAGWAGSLNYMYPGEGYKLKTANAFNFVVPPYKSLPNWNVNENQFEQNESVTADLQFNGVSTTESHFLVGAFANGICIGLSQPQFLAALNLYRVFVTVQGDTGNAGQAITFKVYDTDNDIEYVPTYMPISVSPDTGVGTVELPYVINVQTTTGINALNYTEGYSLLQNVPNPFSQTTSIQYTLPSSQNVSLTLYDESGRMIRELVNGTQTAGNHTVSFEQDNLSSGVYFYQMKAGDFVKTRRMMIIQ